MAAKTAPWQNADGLQVKLPSYYVNASNFVNRPRYIKTTGPEKCIVIDYDLTHIPASGITKTADLDNDGTLDGFSQDDAYVPAYASFTRCQVVATVTAAGGTSIKLGTFGLTGSAVDDDALLTATEGVTAKLAIGMRVPANGAEVANTLGTEIAATNRTADMYLALTATGTFTAGKGKIYVWYLDPLVDS